MEVAYVCMYVCMYETGWLDWHDNGARNEGLQKSLNHSATVPASTAVIEEQWPAGKRESVMDDDCTQNV